MCRKWLLVITILLLTCSCGNTKKSADPVVRIETEVSAIETKFPKAKPHVDAIRDVYPDIQELQEEVEESSFKKYLPWVFAVVGTLLFIWGIKTDDIEDTFFGIVSVIMGMVIYEFWTVLTWAGLLILITSVIGVGVLASEWKRNRKTNNNE